jgi:hypothetical protein
MARRTKQKDSDEDRDIPLEEAEAKIEEEGLNVAEFYFWLEGQTCPMLPNGKLAVFSYDLNRWLAFKKNGVEPTWD